MATQLQIRRGTSSQVAAFTGAEGEVVVNTTNDSIHVNDGSTAGGFELARADLNNVSDSDLNAALTGNTVSALTVTALTTGSITTTGNISFGDNDKAIFGAGSDLQIYHDGSNSYISEVGTGELVIQARDAVTIEDGTSSDNYIYMQRGNKVSLFYAGAEKLATTSTGIDVTGTVTATDLTLSDGTNPTLTITDTTNTTSLFLEAANLSTTVGTSTNHPLKFDTNNIERIRIDESGLVGIGTSSPSSYHSPADNLVIGSSGDNGLTIASGTSSGGTICFADGTSGGAQYAGFIDYQHNGDYMRFGTNLGVERLRIDSSGNVEVKGGQELRVYRGDNATYGSMKYLTGSGGLQLNDKNGDGISFVKADGATEYGRFDASGNFGIGGTPSSWNTVTNVLQMKSQTVLAEHAGTGYLSQNWYYNSGEKYIGNGYAVRQVISSVNGSYSIATAGNNTSGAGAALTWSERMRIDSSGRVSVGTKAWITSDANVGYFGGNDTQSNHISFYDSLNLCRIYTNGSERMRIDSSGNLLVAKSGSSFGTDGFQANADGQIWVTNASASVTAFNRRTTDGAISVFYKDGVSVGSISTNSNSLPSDRNFKRNIQDLSLGLNFISSLDPVTYNYKIDDDGAPVMAGLIAQDVEIALAAAGVEANSMTLLQHNPTEDEKESDYQMDYLKLVPVLINAVKELTERLEQLENN